MKLSNRNGGNAGGFVVLVAVLLMGLILAGCAKRESISLADDSASADQHLPFEAASDKEWNFPHRIVGTRRHPCRNSCNDSPAVVSIQRQFAFGRSV